MSLSRVASASVALLTLSVVVRRACPSVRCVSQLRASLEHFIRRHNFLFNLDDGDGERWMDGHAASSRRQISRNERMESTAQPDGLEDNLGEAVDICVHIGRRFQTPPSAQILGDERLRRAQRY